MNNAIVNGIKFTKRWFIVSIEFHFEFCIICILKKILSPKLWFEQKETTTNPVSNANNFLVSWLNRLSLRNRRHIPCHIRCLWLYRSNKKEINGCWVEIKFYLNATWICTKPLYFRYQNDSIAIQLSKEDLAKRQ